MSRNRIAANTAIFSKLDRYCSERGVQLDTQSNARWIATQTSAERHVLDHLSVGDVAYIGPGRVLAIGYLDTNVFIFTFGCRFSDPPPDFLEIDPSPSLITVALSELSIPVSASPFEVKDIVDFQDGTDDGYHGHDGAQVLKLFGDMRVFSAKHAVKDQWNTLFRICVEERGSGQHKIDAELKSELTTLAELDPNRLPYRMLCRSMFDSDPSSLFLALYRCLESLYAYSSAKEIGRRFQLETDWLEIASTLEDVTGWYPREEASLEKLLRLASKADLEKIVVAGGQEIISGQTESLKAAKAIYRIRNSVVHYRPSHQVSELAGLDWTELSKKLVGIILDVYVEAGHPVQSLYSQ